MTTENTIPETIEVINTGEDVPLTDDVVFDPIAALNAENEILNAQVAEYKDKNLRLLADMENIRRRTLKEIADARTFAVTNFARDLLSVADNLGRAVEAAEGTSDIKPLLDGVNLTAKELLNVLSKHGVKEIIPVGEKFNPNHHQAMFEVPTDEMEPGTVMQVAQSGFVIGERVLRPALVGVSKKA
jgi:molecular chaperone GrpE